MRSIPAAIGYLNRDVAGERLQWNQAQIRDQASRLGYDLVKMTVYGPEVDDHVMRLLNSVENLDVDAVITISLQHFGDVVPRELVNRCELNTIAPAPATYARRFDAIRRATGS